MRVFKANMWSIKEGKERYFYFILAEPGSDNMFRVHLYSSLHSENKRPTSCAETKFVTVFPLYSFCSVNWTGKSDASRFWSFWWKVQIWYYGGGIDVREEGRERPQQQQLCPEVDFHRVWAVSAFHHRQSCCSLARFRITPLHSTDYSVNRLTFYQNDQKLVAFAFPIQFMEQKPWRGTIITITLYLVQFNGWKLFLVLHPWNLKCLNFNFVPWHSNEYFSLRYCNCHVNL